MKVKMIWERGLLLTLFFNFYITYSQVSLPNIENFAVGEEYRYRNYPLQWGWTGTGITCGETWNIQATNPQGLDTVKILSPASTPYGSGLPANTVAFVHLKRKGNAIDTLYYYYHVNANYNHLVRFVRSLPYVGKVIVNYPTNPEKVITRPFQYMSIIQDISARTYGATIQGQPITFDGGCSFNASGAACGTLIFGSNSISNVLKIPYTRNCMDSANTIFGYIYVNQKQFGISFYNSSQKNYLVNIDTVTFQVMGPVSQSIKDTNFEIHESLYTGISEAPNNLLNPVIWINGNIMEIYFTNNLNNLPLKGDIYGFLYEPLGKKFVLKPIEVSNQYIKFYMPHILMSGIYYLVLQGEDKGIIYRGSLPLIK